ncbi:MipA/OmpV family protein [Acinetobacter bereziniae]|uniref:MipA/OmpV family protein n=1 Tax=Acinetobacter bereziniae TaxID=106648 RepID=UPI00124E2B9E|nr:MipA/OmpV family protein [Acinetobacter bereziniae]MCU4316118.1 MipA/OmpV family protein [Acinetobacter bereziniae]
MLKRTVFTTLLCFPFVVFAADVDKTINQSNKVKGVSLGMGVVGRNGMYVGEKTEVIPVPVIAYESDRFFVRGLYAGANLYQNQVVEFSAIANASMMILDVDKLSTKKLAEKNLNKSQLDDRDLSVDLGFEGLIHSPYGQFSLQAVNDVGGASKGAELRLKYEYFWSLSPELTIIPNVGVSWLSDKRANYYYGVLDSEVARGVTSYKPNQLFVPQASLGAIYNITKNISLSGAVKQEFLPNKAQNGPLINEKTTTIFYTGLTYNF